MTGKLTQVRKLLHVAYYPELVEGHHARSYSRYNLITQYS